MIDHILVLMSLQYLNTPYKFGANGPYEFDCSGVVLLFALIGLGSLFWAGYQAIETAYSLTISYINKKLGKIKGDIDWTKNNLSSR